MGALHEALWVGNGLLNWRICWLCNWWMSAFQVLFNRNLLILVLFWCIGHHIRPKQVAITHNSLWRTARDEHWQTVFCSKILASLRADVEYACMTVTAFLSFQLLMFWNRQTQNFEKQRNLHIRYLHIGLLWCEVGGEVVLVYVW